MYQCLWEKLCSEENKRARWKQNIDRDKRKNENEEEKKQG